MFVGGRQQPARHPSRGTEMWPSHVRMQFSSEIALGQQSKQPLGSPASFTLAFGSWLLGERSHPLRESKQPAPPAWPGLERAPGAAVRLRRVLREVL